MSLIFLRIVKIIKNTVEYNKIVTEIIIYNAQIHYKLTKHFT